MTAIGGERPEWQRRAACRGLDPEIFYPERGANGLEAKKICATCPVREQCLAYAVDNVEKFGVWGETTERERRRVRARRSLAQRQCPWCRVTFTPSRNVQVYCGPDHALAAKSARKTGSNRRAG